MIFFCVCNNFSRQMEFLTAKTVFVVFAFCKLCESMKSKCFNGNQNLPGACQKTTPRSAHDPSVVSAFARKFSFTWNFEWFFTVKRVSVVFTFCKQFDFKWFNGNQKWFWHLPTTPRYAHNPLVFLALASKIQFSIEFLKWFLQKINEFGIKRNNWDQWFQPLPEKLRSAHDPLVIMVRHKIQISIEFWTPCSWVFRIFWETLGFGGCFCLSVLYLFFVAKKKPYFGSFTLQ